MLLLLLQLDVNYKKKAEILSHLDLTDMRHKIMDFPFKPREQKILRKYFFTLIVPPPSLSDP